MVKDVFNESLSFEESTALTRDMEANSGVPQGSTTPHIDQEVLLGLFMEARTKMMLRAHKVSALLSSCSSPSVL